MKASGPGWGRLAQACPMAQQPGRAADENGETGQGRDASAAQALGRSAEGNEGDNRAEPGAEVPTGRA